MDSIDMPQTRAVPVSAPLVRPAGEGRFERILGVTQIYKLESADTAGQAICVEVTVPPGEGIPPHTHTREDEAFHVLEGSVVVEDGTHPTVLAAGGFFYGPRNQVHTFRNESDVDAKLLVFITPGDNMERMFGELHHRTVAGTADPQSVAALCARYGIEFAARE